MNAALHHPRWHRNQVEHALWRYFQRMGGHGTAPDGEPLPTVFQSRVKKCLNLDRLPGIAPWDGVEEVAGIWAYFDSEPEGVGSEERFSVYHGFALGITLSLMDLGIKQSDAVYFAKAGRESLEKAFKVVHKRPGAISPVTDAGRQHREAGDHPTFPTTRVGSCEVADFTVWLIVERVSMKEVWPALRAADAGSRARAAAPEFLSPTIAKGVEAVKGELFTHQASLRRVMLLEIAELGLTLPRLLAEAPNVRRGRPKTNA